MQRHRMGFIWLLAIRSFAACTSPVEVPEALPPGGQSGTDGSGDTILDCAAFEPLDRSREWNGVPLTTLISTVVGTHTLSGEWVFGEGHSDLEVVIADLGGGLQRPSNPEPVCTQVRIPIQLSLRVGDSFVAGPTDTELVLQYGQNVAYAGLDFDATAFAHPEQLPEARYVGGGGAALELALSTNASNPSTARVHWGELSIGEFGSGRQVRHFPLPEVADNCRDGELMGDSFPDESAALQAIAGRWALCDVDYRVPFAGVEIREDYTWSAIRGAGALELGMGFSEEGIVRLIDTSVMNHRPGQYQLELAGPNWVFPTSDASLVRLSHPIVDARQPTFGVGERAGASGCASNETEFELWPTDDTGVNGTLVGTWAICSGGSGSVRFDATGQAEFLDATGQSITSDVYSAHPLGSTGWFPPGYVSSVTFSDEYWEIVRSAYPVKLQAVRHSIVDGANLGTLELSAMPD